MQTDVGRIVVLDNLIRGKLENLRRALQDPRVSLVRGDILNRDQLRRAVEGADGVFHLAALWLLECVENPRAGLETNVVGTYNVIEACRDAGVEKLVFSSSASVYGDAVYAPMDEAHPFNNRTFYGATKIAGEQFLRAFNEMYGLNYVALRYFNVYGPRQDYKGTYTNVIMKVLDRLDHAQPPIIYGDGRQAYDFIFVTDVARANVLALQSDVSDVALNVTTGVKTSINDLVALLLELTGSGLRPTYRPTSQVFVTDRLGDPTKAASLIGFRPSVSLRDGLRQLIEWRADRIRVEEAMAA
jgi:UDP-glucose 4-epimerase